MELARPLTGICVLRPGFWGRLRSSIAAVYCRSMHGRISRPVQGKYFCWRCLREFPVRW
jgi:hypothetical protein